MNYSCLYVSMCRAVGVKVRLVSGLGRSGSEWGEHVWNQIYDPAEESGSYVDPTYGSADTITSVILIFIESTNMSMFSGMVHNIVPTFKEAVNSDQKSLVWQLLSLLMFWATAKKNTFC